jgi:ABC-type Fe3+/spermidine/putrescine transport system ATPase subunit
MSDRIAVMSEGLVEQVGSPEEIYHRPASAFVANFIGEANLLAGTVKDRHAGEVDVALAGAVVPVPAPAGGPASGDDVLVMVRPEQVRLARERPTGHPALEATVREIIFRGPSVRVELSAGEALTVVANTADDRVLDGLRPGATVWAGWETGASSLVPMADPRLIGSDDEPDGGGQ